MKEERKSSYVRHVIVIVVTISCCNLYVTISINY